MGRAVVKIEKKDRALGLLAGASYGSATVFRKMGM